MKKMRRAYGSIIELSEGRYRIFATGKYIDPKTGKKARPNKVVRGTERDAERELVKLHIKANNIKSISLPLRDYVSDIYLPYCEELVDSGKLKQTTLDSYRHRLEAYALPAIGDLMVGTIEASDIRYALSTIESVPMQKEVHKTLSAMFTVACKVDGLRKDNPVKEVKPPEPPHYEPDVLDAEDIEVYFWHFRGTRLEPIVLLAIGGSFRRGELDALNVEDVDLDTGRVVVDDAYTETSKGRTHTTPKNKKARITYLAPFILERLREVMPETGPIAYKLGGGRLSPSSLSRLYRQALETLPEGVPHITLKNLRHTGQTLSYDASGNLDRVADHGGHSPKVAKAHYIREHEHQEKLLAAEVDDYAKQHGYFGLKVSKNSEFAQISTRDEDNKKGDSEESPGSSWCPQRESNPCLSLERSKWCFGFH